MAADFKPSMTAAKLLRVSRDEPSTIRQLAAWAGISESSLHGCRQAAAKLTEMGELRCIVPPTVGGRRVEHLYAVTDAGRLKIAELDSRAPTGDRSPPSLRVGRERILLTPGEAERLRKVLETLRAI